MLVKPLAWREPTNRPQDQGDALLITDGIGGQYSITSDVMGGFSLWWAHDMFLWTRFPTISAAKNAAQADFEERLMACFVLH